MKGPINIGVDARILSIKPKGIAKVFRNLVKEINKIDSKIMFYLFFKEELLDPEDFLNKSCKFIHLKPIKGDRFDTWMQIKLPFAIKKERMDLSFFPANRIPLIQPTPSLVILHDTKILRRKPKNLIEILNKYLLLKALRNASIIITVSQYSKENMVREFKLSQEKIHIIYNGISNKFRIIKNDFVEREIKSKYRLPNNYLFALGSPNPDKNTSILIDVIMIIKNYGFHDLKLLISGLVERESVEYFKKLAKDKGVKDQIIITGYVSEDDLVALYNFADIFLYPQTDEGFGLPPLEAMACGTPVIASNSSAIPEIVGDAAILTDPYDAKEIAIRIIELRKKLQNPSIKYEIIQKGLNRVSRYSFEDAAKTYVELFRQLSYVRKN